MSDTAQVRADAGTLGNTTPAQRRKSPVSDPVDLLEMAWEIMNSAARAEGFDAPPGWREAARQWSEQYHKWLFRWVSEHTP